MPDLKKVAPGLRAPGAGIAALIARSWLLARSGLDQLGTEGKAGQASAAVAAGLVPDPVQVGADGADADVELGGDLGVGAALSEEGDQLPFLGAEHCHP